MTAPVAAIAARRRNERDAADPVGAVARDQFRALLTVVLTGIWGGAALIVVTTVAPAAFRVLPTRALAGALVGQVLPVIFFAGMVVGMLAFAMTARASARLLLRRIGAAGVIAGCAIAQLVIGAKIAALRVQIGPNLDALAVTDPLRVAFGKLHALSVLSLGIAMIFALVTLVGAVLAARPRTD